MRTPAPDALAEIVPVVAGRGFAVSSPPEVGRASAGLAAELTRVLERFAADAGFIPARPVPVAFRPGVVGHHRLGRALDIEAVGGIGMEEWKARWDRARARAARSPADEARRVLERERASNLGWRLYTALRDHGRWARPEGFPVQLFGPWTREEGPWSSISDRLLFAHHDHIHVAR